MPWQPYNPNTDGNRVGDCPVRAIAAATGDDWDGAYWRICIEGALLHDMPNADRVWGAYLTRCGFRRRLVAADCARCYTVRDFAREHPKGVYVLGLDGHVLTVIDGDWWDTWDSGDEIPIYYWQRGEEADNAAV